MIVISLLTNKPSPDEVSHPEADSIRIDFPSSPIDMTRPGHLFPGFTTSPTRIIPSTKVEASILYWLSPTAVTPPEPTVRRADENTSASISVARSNDEAPHTKQGDSHELELESIMESRTAGISEVLPASEDSVIR